MLEVIVKVSNQDKMETIPLSMEHHSFLLAL